MNIVVQFTDIRCNFYSFEKLVKIPAILWKFYRLLLCLKHTRNCFLRHDIRKWGIYYVLNHLHCVWTSDWIFICRENFFKIMFKYIVKNYWNDFRKLKIFKYSVDRILKYLSWQIYNLVYPFSSKSGRVAEWSKAIGKNHSQKLLCVRSSLW